MKKICFFVGNLNLSGGTERVSTSIANALQQNGYHVFMLNLWQGENPFFSLHSAIENHQLFSQKKSFVKNYVQVVLSLRKFIQANDIDILVDVECMLAMFSVPALWRFKVHHICWEHFHFKQDLGKKTRNWSRQLALVFAHDIVVLTERDKNFWQKGQWKFFSFFTKLFSKRANVQVIHNPSPYQNIQSFVQIENKIFLSVGRLTYQKGFDLLLAAWAKAVTQMPKGWRLQIVGSGEDQETLQKLTKHLKIEDSVLFLGNTSQIQDFYQQASFYCLSSRFEGLPMVLLEAQSFGLPVIAFDCDCGPAEIITENQNGFLCPPQTIDALSEKIILASQLNKAKYTKMSMSAKKNTQRFELENILLRWIDLLEST